MYITVKSRKLITYNKMNVNYLNNQLASMMDKLDNCTKTGNCNLWYLNYVANKCVELVTIINGLR